MIERWVALVVSAGFIYLASYAYGTASVSAKYAHTAQRVIITAQDSHNCGDNWACLLQWSSEYHAPKKRR